MITGNLGLLFFVFSGLAPGYKAEGGGGMGVQSLMISNGKVRFGVAKQAKHAVILHLSGGVRGRNGGICLSDEEEEKHHGYYVRTRNASHFITIPTPQNITTIPK